MSNQIFSFICLLLVLVSCQSEPVVNQKSYPGVSNQLWSYFERFENEASKRGFDIDLTGITGVIQHIEETGVAGQCTYGHFEAHVTMDQEFWSNANDIYREFVVFHELGHCFLGRGHNESQDSNGICLSLMRSGLTDCRDNYKMTTRVKYLDELFYGTE